MELRLSCLATLSLFMEELILILRALKLGLLAPLQDLLQAAPLQAALALPPRPRRPPQILPRSMLMIRFKLKVAQFS